MDKQKLFEINHARGIQLTKVIVLSAIVIACILLAGGTWPY
jgi:hypothetical protein